MNDQVDCNTVAILQFPTEESADKPRSGDGFVRVVPSANTKYSLFALTDAGEGNLFPILVPPPALAPVVVRVNAEKNQVEIALLFTMVLDLQVFSSLGLCSDQIWLGENQYETDKQQYPPTRCPITFSLSLPCDDLGGDTTSFKPANSQDPVLIHFEPLNSSTQTPTQEFLITTAWENSFNTRQFNLPLSAFPYSDHSHYFFKLTTNLRLKGPNPAHAIDSWQKNEVYLKFHPFTPIPQEIANSSTRSGGIPNTEVVPAPPVVLTQFIPLERWFLDAKHTLGHAQHTTDFDNGNTILDLDYEPIGWDLKVDSTTLLAFTIAQFINKDIKEQQELTIDHDDMNHVATMASRLPGANSVVVMKRFDEVIEEITIHITGGYEFREASSPVIIIKCSGIAICTSTEEVRITKKAIAVKVRMDSGTTKDGKKKLITTPKTLTISFVKNSIQIVKKSLTHSATSANFNPTPIATAPKTAPVDENVNIIAHISVSNSTSHKLSYFNLAVTFPYGSNPDDVPSSLGVLEHKWLSRTKLYLICGVLGFFLLLLLIVAIRICLRLIHDQANADLQSVMRDELDSQVNLIQGQFKSMFSSVSQVIDEYQPPKYENLTRRDPIDNELDDGPNNDLETSHVYPIMADTSVNTNNSSLTSVNDFLSSR